MRRHHLIEESKAELDVAYDQVKRAEQQIMDLEYEYNQRISEAKQANGNGSDSRISDLMAEKMSRQDKLDLDTLYDLQTMSVERFSIVSAAFTIVSTINDDQKSADLMRKLLFNGNGDGRLKIEVDTLFRTFSQGLRAYTREASTKENDQKVRGSWAKIEDLLRRQGRNI